MKKEWQVPDLEIHTFSVEYIISDSPADPVTPDKGYQGTNWL